MRPLAEPRDSRASHGRKLARLVIDEEKKETKTKKRKSSSNYYGGQDDSSSGITRSRLMSLATNESKSQTRRRRLLLAYCWLALCLAGQVSSKLDARRHTARAISDSKERPARLQHRSLTNHNHLAHGGPLFAANSSANLPLERRANSSASSGCQSSIESDFPPINQTSGGGGGGGAATNSGQLQYERNQNRSFGYTETKISDFVRPTFYTIRLKVDPTKRKFTGQLMIALEVGPPGAQQAPSVDSIDELLDGQRSSSNQQQRQGQPRPAVVMRNKNGELGYRYLTLNAGASIHIRKAFYVFKSTGSIQIPALRIGRALDSELLTLDFYPNVITSGQGLLLIVYTGQVNEAESQGLFVHHSSRGSRSNRLASKSAHQDDSGLATHMQPNFARRLFPSWDEPHLKARFNLIVVLPFRGYQSISNMPIKRKSISLSSCSGEPLQEIEFETTPTMSTYLLTLIIGRFDRIDSITANNCKISVYVYANQTDSYRQQSISSQLQQHANHGKEKETTGHDDQQQQVNARRHAAQMALNVAVESFDRFESMLGVRYPLQKFDMVALREFDNGGMENWGASIFHENYLLLYDALNQSGTGASAGASAGAGAGGGGTQSAASQEIQVNGGRQRARRLVVPLVVAHEIAHQWFGNLLTSASWTYLWLNEGFAQLFMYDVADTLFPHENYWHLFLEDSRQAAMHEDELFTASHALEFELADSNASSLAADQLSLFDQLTYNKGAMVVRMLKTLLLGSQPFVAGLHHYLLKHSYDVVTSRNLWLALEESSQAKLQSPMEPLMSTWLREDGFPLISVQLIEETASQYKLRLSQERFLLLSLQLDSLSAEQFMANYTKAMNWSVPILFATERQPDPGESQMLLLEQQQPPQLDHGQTAYLMREKWATISLAKSQVGAWFKLNSKALGYYRVDYQATPSTDLLQRLKPAIQSKTLGPIDRFNLVDDLFAMVKATRKSSAYFLRFIVDSFGDETEVIVMRAIVDSLRRIKSTIVSNSGDPRMHSLFDRYVQKYLRKVSQSAATGLGRRSQFSSKRSADSIQQRPANSNQQRRELEDLIDGARISISSSGQQQAPAGAEAKELVLRALDLFARHFRQPSAAPTKSQSQPPTSTSTSTSPLDWMDRETRASIYSAALMGASGDADLPANFSLMDELRAESSSSQATLGPNQPTDPILSAFSSLSPVAIEGHQQEEQPSPTSSSSPSSSPSPSPSSSSSSSSSQSQPQPQPSDDTFLRLLKAYESSESSAERFSICSALGTVSLPNKRLKLLELALFEHYFRPSDTLSILDSMARQKAGRQLIWQTLKSQSKSLERRQLLAGLLRSLWPGFIDPDSGGGSNSMSPPSSEIESFLRALFQQYGSQYGKLIGQTVELLRINSHWFNRDHDSLLQFLLSAAAAANGGRDDEE